MPLNFNPWSKQDSLIFDTFFQPSLRAMDNVSPLKSSGNRPLQMNFEDQLRILVYYHLQEHASAQHLLQELEQDEFARDAIAPEKGIKKSAFSEAINGRGLEQMMHVFENLRAQADGLLPGSCPELGSLVGIDGSLVDATLSMYWADYRKGSKKAKVHVGFDINKGIPRKVFLTDGNGAERPFVGRLLDQGQTGVLDRGYQSHQRFDQWQRDNIQFICRIKAKTTKTILKTLPVAPDSSVFFDAMVLLGTRNVNETQTPLRLVGYKIDGVKYWLATNRCDLTGEQIAAAYKLRWDIENFFAWWKRHLKVYHLIARSRYGLMVQIIAGLITYLLLAIYCHKQHQEKVSIRRVRQLRIQIQNELRAKAGFTDHARKNQKEHKLRPVNAKT